MDDSRLWKNEYIKRHSEIRRGVPKNNFSEIVEGGGKICLTLYLKGCSILI